jgi:hypothetical protein
MTTIHAHEAPKEDVLLSIFYKVELSDEDLINREKKGTKSQYMTSLITKKC